MELAASSDELKALLGLESLWLHIEERQLSDNKAERKRIRTRLRDELKDLLVESLLYNEEAFTWEDLLDLEQIPKLPFAQVSISHNPQVVGFAISGGHKPIGFDLEVKDRVKLETASRIATGEELSEAPTPAHLWAAKEAAFKSLRGGTQPTTISEINVHSWSEATATIHQYFYKCRHSMGLELEGRGVTEILDSLILSLSTVSP